jgi:branched-subunit amino acid transport protein
VNAWIAVLAAGLGSYAFRVGTVLILDRVVIPPWFGRVSAYVMPAVFAGLVAGSLAEPLTRQDAVAMPVLAGAAATAVVARRRSAALAVAAGMSTLWITTILGALA